MTTWDAEGYVVFVEEDIPWMRDFVSELREKHLNKLADEMAREIQKIEHKEEKPRSFRGKPLVRKYQE
jgi:hypothetical protein